MAVAMAVRLRTDAEASMRAGMGFEASMRTGGSVFSPSLQLGSCNVDVQSPESKVLGRLDQMSCFRRQVILYLEWGTMDMILGAVILFNMFLLVIETDAAVHGDVPRWVTVGNYCLLGVYCIELCCRFFAYRCVFFLDGWNVMDLVIVGSDLVFLLLDIVLGGMDSPNVSVLRAARLVRLVRAFKALSMFPELASLIRGFMCAVKSIFWGMLLILIVIIVWSILAVQLIHPLNQDLKERGAYRDCSRCASAFESVFESSLTIFQTLVAGDSWGTYAVPIIEEFPVASIYFLLVLVTVSLAIMNLILAVIVERAQDTQQMTMADQLADMAAQRDLEFQQAASMFKALCEQLDQDNDGHLTKEELLSGFELPDFANMMKVLGLKIGDMDVLYDSLDEDGSGEVDHEKMVDMLYRFHKPSLGSLFFEVSRLQQQITRLQWGTNPVSFERATRCPGDVTFTKSASTNSNKGRVVRKTDSHRGRDVVAATGDATKPAPDAHDDGFARVAVGDSNLVSKINPNMGASEDQFIKKPRTSTVSPARRSMAVRFNAADKDAQIYRALEKLEASVEGLVDKASFQCWVDKVDVQFQVLGAIEKMLPFCLDSEAQALLGMRHDGTEIQPNHCCKEETTSFESCTPLRPHALPVSPRIAPANDMDSQLRTWSRPSDDSDSVHIQSVSFALIPAFKGDASPEVK